MPIHCKQQWPYSGFGLGSSFALVGFCSLNHAGPLFLSKLAPERVLALGLWYLARTLGGLQAALAGFLVSWHAWSAAHAVKQIAFVLNNS